MSRMLDWLKTIVSLFFFIVIGSTSLDSFADTELAGTPQATLPYTNRTHGFSGWSSTIRGDIRTLGMAGAMVGLADTVIGSTYNPAGLAITLENINLQTSSNRIRDGNVQTFSEVSKTSNIGLAINPYPYGFSFGYWQPQREGQLYRLFDTGETVRADVQTREFRFSAARLFCDDKLSLGSSLIFGQSIESIDFPGRMDYSSAHHAYSVGTSFGAMYHFSHRWLLGLSLSPSQTFDSNSDENPSTGVAGFFKPVKKPAVVGIGIGWVPNRFFRFGTSLNWVGTTENTALLSDDNRMVGQNGTLQPRVGASYVAAEFNNFKVELAVGSYLEISRIQNTPSRPHATAGVELSIWAFNFGWGVDQAPRYDNFIYSGGIDVIRLARKLSLVPKDTPRPNGKIFPPILKYSDEGIPRPLIENWKEGTNSGQPDVIQIGLDVPKRIQEKLMSVPEDLESIGQEFMDSLQSIPDLSMPDLFNDY